MHLPDSFTEILCRLPAGDEDAATLIFHHLKPRIERRATTLMRYYRIPLFYSGEDTCGWVLGHFMVQVRREQMRFPNITEALKYTLAMTRNWVLDLARTRRHERDLQAKRAAAKTLSLEQIADARANPDEIVHRRERVAQVRQQLSADDWKIVWSRTQGQSWPEIGRQAGSTPDAARIRYSRVVAKIRCKLAS